MVKVWILEVWQTREEVKKLYDECLEMGIAEEWVSKTKELLETMETGRWVGIVGKTGYETFCRCARETIRHRDKDDKYRVVKAQCADDAKYWTGYTDGEENDGVLRFLYATTRR